jgi:hypothetical protein
MKYTIVYVNSAGTELQSGKVFSSLKAAKAAAKEKNAKVRAGHGGRWEAAEI